MNDNLPYFPVVLAITMLIAILGIQAFYNARLRAKFWDSEARKVLDSQAEGIRLEVNKLENVVYAANNAITLLEVAAGKAVTLLGLATDKALGVLNVAEDKAKTVVAVAEDKAKTVVADAVSASK